MARHYVSAIDLDQARFNERTSVNPAMASTANISKKTTSRCASR
ncbi:MAG: hypothetical protein HW386_875, partial [Gammaproteobacteria bacterium]|nr:hypothetical protein [Gammaproteobacteria bacterium]